MANPSISFFSPASSLSKISYLPELRWDKNVIRYGGNAEVGVRFRFRVRVRYTKRRMETPGAYELIDEVSGDKVIVWGGVDDGDVDDDSTLPSNDLLTLIPDNQNNKTNDNDDVDHTATVNTKRLPTSFGRLRPLKFKTNAKLNSPQTSKHKDHDLPVSKMTKKKIGDKSSIHQLLHNQPSINSFDSDDELASLNVSPSKGWNSREPTLSSRVAQRDLKYNDNNAAGGVFFSRKSFGDLGCTQDMIDSLKAQHFVRPSNIQAMAYEPAKIGKSCIIADQSGSGKTLAYLAPLIQRLRQEEIQGLSISSSRSPRAVILVPTAELASQVLRNCRSISKHGVPFRSIVATGGFRQRTQLESLEQDLDVLIVTPGRFKYLIKEGFLRLTNLRCAVLDEVDILFSDEDFEQAFQSLINSSPVTTQYLFVTATLPIDIYNKLVTIFPDCEVIMGPGMHRTSIGLEEVLVDCSGADGSEKSPVTAFSNKKSALLKLAEESQVSRTIIFCNKIETCRKVENAMRRLDRNENRIRILPFHAALEQETRLANMKEFLNSVTESRSLFLVCTDRASRGIDFTNVDHVVLFDFPRDPSEYVRRVGRTARGAGGKGKAFVFVVGKQASLARRIIERNLKGHPLHEVPSSYELLR